MILAPTNRRIIRPNDKPSFEHTQRYGLIKGHWANRNRVGLWLFNEGSGGQVLDLSRNGNEGARSGTGIVWASGKFGAAQQFNEIDDYLDCDLAPRLDSETISFVMWMKPGTQTTNNVFLAKGSYQIEGWYLWQQTNNNIVLAVNSDGFQESLVAGSFFSPNEWQQIAVVFNKTKVYWYKNGIPWAPDPDDDITLDWVVPVGRNLFIGDYHSHGTYNWNGIIDHLSIYNGNLSASEIALLYREPFLGIERRAAPVYFFVPDVGAIKELAGTVAIESTAAGELTKTGIKELAGAVIIASTVTGVLSTTRGLAGVVTIATIVTGELTKTGVKGLAGVVVISTTVLGELTRTGIQLLAGVVTIKSTTAGILITSYTEIPPLMEKDLIDPFASGAWLWLVQFAVPGESTVRIARDTADVHYDGNDFDKFNLQIGEQIFSSDGSIPRVTLRVFQDINRTVEDLINATEGALGAQVKLIRVNEKFLTSPVAALEFDYDNLASESDSEWCTFTLGIPNPLTQRFPLRNYSSSMCPWANPELFKGPDCQYAGGDGTCTGTYEDCYVKGNAVHWGGELGLSPSVVTKVNR